MRISDWSSDVCSSDLRRGVQAIVKALFVFIVITLDHEVISPGIIPPPLESQIVLVGNPLNLAHVIKVAAMEAVMLIRSDKRRVGKECVSTCRSRRAPTHQKKKH